MAAPVQQKTGSAASASSVVVTFTSPPTVGNHLMVVVGHGLGVNRLANATAPSGGSASWTHHILRAGTPSGAGSGYISLWEGTADGTSAITVNVDNTAADDIVAWLLEWGNAPTTFDSVGTGVGNSVTSAPSLTASPSVIARALVANLRTPGFTSPTIDNSFVFQSGAPATALVAMQLALLDNFPSGAVTINQTYGETGGYVGNSAYWAMPVAPVNVPDAFINSGFFGA